MWAKIRDRMYAYMTQKKYKSDEELYRFVLMLVITVGAGFIHFFYVLFFLSAVCYPLSILNALCLLGYTIAYYQIRKDRFDMLAVFIATEIVLSTTISLFFVGADNYFFLYFYLVLLMQLVIPFQNRRIPVVISFSLIPFLVLSFHLDGGYLPPVELDGAKAVLTLVNMGFMFLSIVLLVTMDKTVRSFLDSYKQTKMEELQDQAFLDSLTGLYNRRYAEQYFKELAHSPLLAENTCLAIADLDDFKKVNDTFGHDAGDTTLKTVAEIMLDNTRKTDRICRWGGEEFLLIINSVTVADAYRTLDKVRQIIYDTPITHDDKEFPISITMGMAQMNVHDITGSLEVCDRKLYVGKNSGKNTVVM